MIEQKVFKSLYPEWKLTRKQNAVLMCNLAGTSMYVVTENLNDKLLFSSY